MCLENINRCKLKSSRIHFLYNLHILQTVLFFVCQRIAALLIFPHYIFQMLLSLAHNLIGKCRGTDGKICRIISQWIIDFTISNSPCHHNISGRMRFREHVLNLFTGSNVPVGNSLCGHCLFPLRLQTFSFTYTFHNRKGQRTVYALANQINHNIVTTTDTMGNIRSTFQNQCLGISKPYVCSMTESGNTNQIRQTLWLRIQKHLYNEVRTEFRYSKGTNRTSINLIRRNSKC